MRNIPFTLTLKEKNTIVEILKSYIKEKWAFNERERERKREREREREREIHTHLGKIKKLILKHSCWRSCLIEIHMDDYA